MALIRCKECNKEVSDTAKTCPHCGYKLNSKNDKLKLISKISNIDIIILGCMICIIILSFSKGTYTLDWIEGYQTVARMHYVIEELLTYILLPNIIFYGIILIIVASLIIKIITDFNKLIKIKFINTVVLTVSSVIYDVLIVYTLLYVEICGLRNGGYCHSHFGAYWISFMALISLGVNIANLIKSIKEKNKIIYNKE